MKELERQLANKRVQLKTLQQKCQLQNKKIKLLRKQNEQFKSAFDKQNQIDTSLLLSSKQLSDANSKLQAAIQELQNQLQQPNSLIKPSIITIANLTINQQTCQVDLPNCSLKDEDILQLSSFTNIQSLNLTQNQLTNTSIQMICEKLTNLRKVYLANNKFNVDGLQKIHNLVQLRHLDLRGNKLGDKVSHYISKLANLLELCLSNNCLTDVATDELSSLANLSYLDITSNVITDEGVKNLIKLKKLTHLYLSSNKIDELGIRWIMKDLKLNVLDVRFNNISNQQKEKIKSLKSQNLQLFV